MYPAREKLLRVSRELGVDPNYMIGTTRAIYDQLPAVEADNTQYSFFDNVSSRTFPDTNIPQNQFESNEALSIEAIGLYTLAATTPALPAGYLGEALINIVIGSQVIIKDLPVKFNSNQGTSKSAANNYALVQFEQPLVIPPLVSFKVEVTNVQSLAVATFSRFGCLVYGMGALINFKTSL